VVKVGGGKASPKRGTWWWQARGGGGEGGGVQLMTHAHAPPYVAFTTAKGQMSLQRNGVHGHELSA